MLEISQSLVRELLDYDPETGALKWRVRDRRWFKTNRSWNTWNTRYAGTPAGRLSQGYVGISIFKIRHPAHRVIWLWMTGGWPKDQIDHENHVRSDNRWHNLREATPAENGKNHSLNSNNKSGVAGVQWRRDVGRWQAHIRVSGRRHYLGFFDDKCTAIAARKAAEAEYGFHPNHGRIAA